MRLLCFPLAARSQSFPLRGSPAAQVPEAKGKLTRSEGNGKENSWHVRDRAAQFFGVLTVPAFGFLSITFGH